MKCDQSLLGGLKFLNSESQLNPFDDIMINLKY